MNTYASPHLPTPRAPRHAPGEPRAPGNWEVGWIETRSLCTTVWMASLMSYINCSNVTEVQHDTEGADERRRGVVVVRPELVSNHLKTGSVRC